MYVIKGPPAVVGGHYPYIECLVLDSDIPPAQTSSGPVEMQVRISRDGTLFIRDPSEHEGAFVDCLSLMKALRMAFPVTFAEVSYGASPAYDTFKRELAREIATGTALDPVGE